MIPDELREREQWVVWRTEPDDKGRMTKRPYTPVLSGTVYRASHSDARTWRSYDAACACVMAREDEFDGIGYVFSDADPYCGIDLDDAFRPDRIARTDRLVQAFNSYTEVSPSGKGLHIIVRGSLASGRRHDGIEVYDRERYFTMTGNPWGGGPVRAIEPRQAVVDRVVAEYMPREAQVALEEPGEPLTPELPDDAVIAAIRRADAPVLRRLLDGTWQEDYPSGSEADFALANHLAYWTGGNYAQVLRILRSTPLWDAKWERTDYQLLTAGRAVRDVLLSGRVAPVHFVPQFERIVPEAPNLTLLDSLTLRVRDLMPTPPSPDDLVPGLLPDPAWVRYALMIGTGGLGKSMFGLQVAMGLAAGLPIAGWWQPRAATRVVFVSGEDSKLPIWNRVHHMAQASGWSEEDIERAHANLRILDLTAHLNRYQLMRLDGSTYVPNLDAIEELVAWVQTGGGCELLLLDTLVRFAAQAEESNPNASAFVAAMESMSEALHAMILALHHTSKSGRQVANQHSARGASALVDNSRHVLNLAPSMKGKVEQPGKVELTIGKASYMARDGARMTLTRGPHGVLQRQAPTTREEQDMAEERGDAELKLHVLDALWGKEPGRYISLRELRSSNLLHRALKGLPTRQVEALVIALERDGLLVRDKRRGWTRAVDEWTI